MKRGVAAGAICAAILLTGCSSGGGGNSIAGAAQSGANGVGQAGPVREVAPGRRGTPIDVSGTLLTGQPWSTADARGKVVVLNVWGSWCGPCQAELPDLQKAWTKLKASGKPVVLMGLDYKEGPATALAAVKQGGITYPSLQDDDGKTVLSLGRYFVGTPTTLVLDTQHRVAASVTGPVDTATLLGLVDDTLAGK